MDIFQHHDGIVHHHAHHDDESKDGEIVQGDIEIWNHHKGDQNGQRDAKRGQHCIAPAQKD